MKQPLFISTLVELADSLVDDFDVFDVLTMLTYRCVEVLDASAAGVVLLNPEGKLQVIASSDESMQALEIYQIQAQEGPCIDCHRSGLPVIRLSLDEARNRWPTFAPLALARGYNSVHCLPLRLRKQTIGSLNFFRTHRGEMEADDVLVAQALADIATIAILQHRTAEDSGILNKQLTGALASRILIEQAKGVVAQSENCSVEDAFSRIRTHARNHNERISDVAAKIVDGRLGAHALDEANSPA